MNSKSLLTALTFSLFGLTNMNSQINLGERALGAISNGIKGFTFSDEDAANIAREAIAKMDKENPVADAKDPYTIRLNRVFGKHANEGGLVLNFKVYKVKDVNAFACADGSVRVFSGLMDIMDDNELLAVIGHEIGHVSNHDSRDGMKAAYKKAALIDAVSSQSGKVAVLTDSQLGQMGSAMLDSRHTRGQESEADTFSYDFMKRNGYNVNAVESAFNILTTLSSGASADFLSKMMASHPDAQERAATAKSRAEADGLYKPYVKQVKGAVKTTKKVTKKKK
jgi:metalloprotease